MKKITFREKYDTNPPPNHHRPKAAKQLTLQFNQYKNKKKISANYKYYKCRKKSEQYET